MDTAELVQGASGGHRVGGVVAARHRGDVLVRQRVEPLQFCERRRRQAAALPSLVRPHV